MKVSSISIKNFRRLENVHFSLEDDHTVFVGPNNSGKTSAAAAFRLFFKRNDFSINDFTVSCIDKIDKLGSGEGATEGVPAIELDMWMSIDPAVEFGRVFSLLPDVSNDFDMVGFRLRFCAKNTKEMQAEYAATFPQKEGGVRKPLSYYLALPGVLSRHFAIRYFALAKDGDTVIENEIEAEEGKRLVHSLIKIDFIDAQRNMNDQEGGRHNRLSAAFAAYYKYNLQKPEENEAANKVVDENNSKLTEHYKEHFRPLLKVIANLGVPSAHDREMQLVSALSPHEALKGSTELYYVDSALQHQLPEAYNGLGFKNLVYMAIQISHFHAQWLTAEKNRELCQLIFIEEPEVHLHAQVQQVFVSNMWNILNEVAKEQGEAEHVPQLVISTHSSHIVDTVDFEKIRYFRRSNAEGAAAGRLNASRVLNLKEFRPSFDDGVDVPAAGDGKDDAEVEAARQAERKRRGDEVLRFLKKYLKLTHCDLFFADAAVLVEGTVEKLLLPQMIQKSAPRLQNKYLTVLEVGGAYAHRFSGLLKFLGIPYVVITDIDTVKPNDSRSACRASVTDSKTSNAALKAYFKKATRAELVAMDEGEQVCDGGACYVTFQRPVSASVGGSEVELHGRTLEEACVYENLTAFRDGHLSIGIDVSNLDVAEDLSEAVYNEIRDNSFKKTEFALDVASSAVDWTTPSYIASGLRWIDEMLEPSKPAEVAEAVMPAAAVAV